MMTIRKSLLIPKIDQERVAYLQELIEEIEQKIDSENVDYLIKSFQKEINYTGFDKCYCESFHSFESSDEFALKAFLLPQVKVIQDITTEELIWLVEQICAAKDFYEYYLALVDINVPSSSICPSICDLIFHPNECGYSDNLTPKQIIEIALKYHQ